MPCMSMNIALCNLDWLLRTQPVMRQLEARQPPPEQTTETSCEQSRTSACAADNSWKAGAG